MSSVPPIQILGNSLWYNYSQKTGNSIFTVEQINEGNVDFVFSCKDMKSMLQIEQEQNVFHQKSSWLKPTLLCPPCSLKVVCTF